MHPYMKLLFIFISSLLFLIQPYSLYSQSTESKVDSILSEIGSQKNDSLLLKEIITVWNTVKFNDPTLSRSLIDKAREIANQSGQESLKDWVDLNEALLYYLSGEFEQARQLYQKSYIYWKGQGNLGNILSRYENILSADYAMGEYEKVAFEADSLANLSEENGFLESSVRLRSLAGISHSFLGNKMLAFQKFLPCISHYQESKDTSRWADNLIYVGETLLDLQQTEKARKYFRQAKLLYTLKNDKFYLIQALSDLGLAFMDEVKPDSALFYLEKSKELNEVMQYSMLPTINLNLAKVQVKTGDIQTAEELLLEGLKVAKEQNDKRNTVSICNSYGEMLLKSGRTEEAFSILKKGEKLAKEIGFQTGKINTYLSLASIHSQRGDLNKATQYWQDGLELKDSLYKTESLRQQNELLIVYETEKKEKELLIKKQENIELKQSVELNKIRIRNLWIVSLLLAGIALLSFLMYRQINLRKLLLQKAKEKELEKELSFQQRELTTHALHLASKNQLLNELKESIARLKDERENKATHQQLIRSIESDQRDEKDWENFALYFNKIYPDFEETLKGVSTELTSNEIRLMTLLKMNLTYKEVAGILNITHDSVHKASYRLRKKLGMNKEQTLQQFILAL